MNAVAFAFDPSDHEGTPATPEPEQGPDVADLIGEVSNAFTMLGEKLEQAYVKMKEAQAARVSELELGQLFSRAQAFVDAKIAGAEEQVATLLQDATAQSSHIVSEANRQAADVLERAQRQAEEIVAEAADSVIISTENIGELNRAINGFIAVNDRLIVELGELREAFSPMWATSGV
jgi:cell division septum initiation protein DivIVA